MTQEKRRGGQRTRSFADREREHQIAFKQSSPYFSDDARRDGPYRGHTVPYCLPADH